MITVAAFAVLVAFTVATFTILVMAFAVAAFTVLVMTFAVAAFAVLVVTFAVAAFAVLVIVSAAAIILWQIFTVQPIIQFFFSCIPNCKHFTLEMKSLTCHWMIEIHCHRILLDLCDSSLDDLS